MTSVGIIGGGVGGMHLALLLQQRDVAVTVYADRTPDEVRESRLASTAGHWGPTRLRERELGINHWDETGPNLASVAVTVHGENDLSFEGYLSHSAITVDYRVTMPRIQEDFASRGGSIVYGQVAASDLDELSEKHSLVVVCAGKGSMTGMFPRVPELCRFDRPQRVISTAIVSGVTFDRPALNYEMVPGTGELLQFPFQTLGGTYAIMYFSVVPNSALARDLDVDLSGGDPTKILRNAMLHAVEKWFPVSSARIDRDEFGPITSNDILRGALTPTVRRPYVQLGNGRWILACGDVHAVHDPVMGQGANSASRSAALVADAIVEDSFDFDEMWCHRTAERMWRSAECSVEFTNEMMCVPPSPQVVALLTAASQSQPLADRIAENFGEPGRQWNMLASMPRALNAVRSLAPEALDAVVGKTLTAGT